MFWRNFCLFLVATFSCYGISWTSTSPTGGFGAGSTPIVQVDSSGNAIAVWIGSGSTTIEFSYYSASTETWSSPSTIATGTNFNSLDFIIDTSANGIAAWASGSGGTEAVQVNIFDPDTQTWGTAADVTAVSAALLSPYVTPKVAVDNDGLGYVVIQGLTGGGFPSLSFRFITFSTGVWSPLLSSNPTAYGALGSLAGPSLTGKDFTAYISTAFAPNDSMLVGVYTLQGTFSSLNLYSPVFGNSTFDLEPFDAGNSGIFNQVAAIDDSNIVAIWSRTLAGSSVMRFLYVTSVSSGTTSAQADISGSTNDAITEPTMVMDGSGNAFAAWVGTNAGVSKIQAAFYTASSNTWSSVFDVSDESASISSPQIAVDLDDRVIVVWKQGDIIYSRENTSPIAAPSSSWDPALASEASQVNTTTGSGPEASPSLGVNLTDDPATGPVFVLWSSGASVNAPEIIGAIEGDAPSASALLDNLRGGQVFSRFPSQGYVVGNALIWNITDPASVSLFKIYRGSTSNLIATTTGNRFIDRSVPAGTAQIYYVSSVDLSDNESDPVIFTVEPVFLNLPE